MCLFQKLQKQLPLKVSDIKCLQEGINFEICFNKKICNFLVLYRSPSQSSDQFEIFLSNFESTLDDIASKNPFLSIVIGDFNAKSSNWYSKDKTSLEGSKIDKLTSQFSFHQIIKEPTHVIQNSSSCIDLLFTSQPNLVLDAGVHPTLHENCHHQIIYAKFDLKVYYLPPYERVVWHYNHADTNLIKRAVNDFNWEDALSNCNVDEQVATFNEVISNIFSNFIPNEKIICNDRDPPWFNNHVRKLIDDKKIAYKRFIRSNKSPLFKRILNQIQEQIINAIDISKQKYYERISSKLLSKKVSPKSYWAILKTLLNGKKVPLIPPLLHENKFIVDFKEKCELFNSFFAKQCSLIDNSSTLPSTMTILTDKSLVDINITQEKIRKIIKRLDPNKAHGHDMISIRMIQLCGETISKPLEMIYKTCLQLGVYPSEWKKANIVPIHKKGDKQILKNYRPVSLLPICGKVFERLIYDEMFEFFNENELISPNQSGFKPGDSCIYQLLSITHEIFTSFDNGLETRGIFLDISKAFDKVWHLGLLRKLRQSGINGKLLTILTDFLKDRKQRVTLNGQNSSWTSINAGVPQGSILGPLFFLIYINDLSDSLNSNPKLFADDTSLFRTVNDINTTSNDLNKDLDKISDWAFQWKMSFNPDPSKQAQEIIFSRKYNKKVHPSLTFNKAPVTHANNQKHLGMILDSKLSFDDHIDMILKKVNRLIGIIRKLHSLIPRSSLLTIYKSFVRPHLDYGDVIYDQGYNKSFHQKVETIQYNAALAITGAIRGTSREKLYQELGLESLEQRRWFRKLCLFFKIYKNHSPSYLAKFIPTTNNERVTRSSSNVPFMNCNHNFFKNSFFPSVICEWNKLDLNIRNSESYAIFRKSILKFIRPAPNKLFGIHNLRGVKLLTRLRLGLSHLNEHKFRHGFQDCLNPLCNCGTDVETTSHFLLHCPNFKPERQTLLSKIKVIDSSLLNRSEASITELLLYGDSKLRDDSNSEILNSTVDYIISTKRFDQSLL